jgi:SAM-dependent methyltransferase
MKVCQACETRFTSGTWSCPSCGWRAAQQGSITVVGGDREVEGFSGEFFDGLARAEEEHFWFRSRNELIAWCLRREFGTANTFLEVGSGTGHVSASIQRAFPRLRVTASEAFAEGLRFAERKAPGVELVQADIRALPWHEEFDVVGAFDVLEHVPDHEQAARELYSVVKPGGGVIVTVPQHQWLWSPIDEYSGHQRRYSRSGLVTLLQGAGFRVGRVTSFVSLLLPTLFLSRWSRRSQPVDPSAEVQLSPIANRIGAAAMSIEHALIRAGVSLPIGSSLLAIGRR